jgi:hypothetical protein
MAGSGEGTPIGVGATFVVEDGSGKSDANSYCSVVDATTYNNNVNQSTTWENATTSEQENALIVGTQYLDIEYARRWRGMKASSTQALAWPRAGGSDDDGYTIDSDVVPEKLKDACAELALRVLLGDDLLGVHTSPGTVEKETVKVGPITESKTYVGGRSAAGYDYPKVSALIGCLIRPAGRVYRG